MERALDLAMRAEGSLAPNPRVGAVLVEEGQVIGEGFHRGPGTPHAEAAALEDALARGRDPRGSTLYVTLEPCCHSGGGKRTPPCAQALAAAGIAKARAGCLDPNPRVSGGGLARLRAAGIDAVLLPLGGRCEDLIADFSVWTTESRASFRLKWAQSLDGKLAARDGSSRWITGEASRDRARLLRSRSSAVMVGAGTLRADDPALTARLGTAREPARIVVAGEGPLPPDRVLFSDGSRETTWIVARGGSAAAAQAPRLVGERLIEWEGRDWLGLGRELFSRGIHEVLVEGGPRLLSSMLRAGAGDSLAVFIAPLQLGSGASLPDSPLATTLADAPRYRTTSVERLGEDVLWEGRRRVHGDR